MKTVVLLCALLGIVISAVPNKFKAPPMTLPLTRKSTGASFSASRWISPRDSANVPLQGSVEAYGEYFVSIGLGTPPQPFDFQVDTGSTDLLVYGVSCNGCPANAVKFNPSTSSTVQPVDCSSPKYTCDTTQCYQPGNYCPFDDAYGDGSDVRGYVLEDVVTIGGFPAKVSLGYIANSSAQFEPTGVDGIFGLAYPTTSSWGSESPLLELLGQNSQYKSFGMCLMKDGGSISLGVNEHDNPNVAFTPTMQNGGRLIYYPVNLTDMKINGQSINVNSNTLNGNYGALVDSGTTLMLFPEAVFNRLRNIFNALCQGVNLPGVCGVQDGHSLFDGICVSMTDQDRQSFPTISVTVPGIPTDLTISPDQYLLFQNASLKTIRTTKTTTKVKLGDDLVWCLGIQPSPPTEPVTILGDTFMRGFYVVFDQESQSVGFGPQSACP